MTDLARDALKDMAGSAESKAFRIVVSGIGWGGPVLGVSLDENNEGDFLETVDGYTFIAADDIKKMVKVRGGLHIDFVKSFFGSRLYVRFASGGCGSC